MKKRNIMPFEKFEYLLNQVKGYLERLSKISDFFEDELCTDSSCIVNLGEDLLASIVCMLADEFDCWYEIPSSFVPSEVIKEGSDIDEYTKILCEGLSEIAKESGCFDKESSKEWWDKSKRRWDNDIEYWLYEENPHITINGKEVPIKTTKEFYDYLIKYYIDKKKS